MKKTAAILLISIHLFSLAGVRIASQYFIRQQSVQFERQIDNGHYSIAQLVEIKVPLTNPYYSSSPGYERYYGEFDLKGTNYRYVMRKVINDTIYLLCLPDSKGSQIKKAGDDLAVAVAGIISDAPIKKGIPFTKKQGFSPEYFYQDHRLGFPGLTRSGSTKDHFIFSEALYSCYIDLPVKPPAMNTGHPVYAA